MVNILALILFILVGLVTVLMLFINFKYWMLHIDRISYSFDNKSSNPVYNKELGSVLQKLTQLNAIGKSVLSFI